MTVKILKEIIKDLPDNVEIVTPSSDHSYKYIYCSVTTALKDDEGEWTEDYGESSTPESLYGKRKKVLVIE